MVSTGVCEVYVQLDDFSNVSGESEHYMDFTLAPVPQVNILGQIMIDSTLNRVYLDSNGYGVIELYRGLGIRLKIPTIGVDVVFTVPDQTTYNLSELLK